MMDNTIDQIAIGELLDGRYFYIPAYQRGYRWTEKQVGDLLKDLLSFIYDREDDTGKRKGNDFYCLQPVITRPITDKAKIAKLFGEELASSVIEHGAWEVIDGQQRFTTLFLVYRYLLEKIGISKEDLKDEDREEYHILYETRDGSTAFLEHLDKSFLEDEVDESAYSTNIDFYHMGKAFRYIDQWILKEGKELSIKHKREPSPRKMREALINLLNGSGKTTDGSVQVLWYQLNESQGQSSIKEFQKINTGKIKLTDAELIKGLFLMGKNFDEGNKIHQSELALEWEFIEDSLHSDKFWYFLQKKGVDMPNRIDLLFSLLYKVHRLEGIAEENWAEELVKINADIQDTSKSVIFRFYNDRFEGKNGLALHTEVDKAWQEVMKLYRTLDDWFCTPSLYNYIGLLSQCGVDITRIILHFSNLPDSATRDEFVSYLKTLISEQLSGITVDKDSKEIKNTYKEHNNIFKLLLTLNIHLVNQQNQEHDSDSEVYKFPFDVLSSQNWDIEHVDSFHTNMLKENEQKKEWIMTALDDLDLSEEEHEAILNLVGSNNYDDAIMKLKEKADEVPYDEEIKNRIGNLTLLDSSTNRQYGNSLFCTKRRLIIERMNKGVYIPMGTQYVFYKLFDKSGTRRSQWTDKDMKAYQDFIFDSLKEYIVPKTEEESTVEPAVIEEGQSND